MKLFALSTTQHHSADDFKKCQTKNAAVGLPAVSSSVKIQQNSPGKDVAWKPREGCDSNWQLYCTVCTVLLLWPVHMSESV